MSTAIRLLLASLCLLATNCFTCLGIASDPPVTASSPERDPDKALQQLQKSYSLFPYNEKIKHDLAGALEAAGQRQLKLRQYDQAAETFDQGRNLLPGQGDFGILRGIALYLGKRYDEAAYELERTRQVTGDRADLLYYLGRVRYDAGDLAAALDAWNRALEMDPESKPVREAAEKARREAAVETKMGKGYRSMFVISYDEGSMSTLADDVLKALENAYNRVGSDLDHYPSVRVPVILYTRTDYRTVTTGPEWSGGLYDGKVRLPIGGVGEVNAVLRGVLIHEYAHVVVRELTGGNCPSWLNEGIAEMQGRAEYDPPLAVLENAAKTGALLTAASLEKSLLGLSGKEAQLAYQQSYSMVKYLVSTYGWHKVKEILVNLGSGMDIGTAVARVFVDYNLDYGGLVQDWQEQVVKEYGRGAETIKQADLW